MSLAGPSTTLTVVQGSALTRTLAAFNADGSVPAQFQATDALTGLVWLAQNEPASAVFAPVWYDATTCRVTVALSMGQTASLAIDTTYNLQVFATRAGVTYCTHWVYLQVQPASGVQGTPAVPDLVSGPYAAQLLQVLSLTPAQLEAIPSLISAASDAIRSWCNRRFDQGTVVEQVPVELDGTIRLARPPINAIQRIQCRPQVALTVSNASAAAAWVNMATIGDVASGQAITGMDLNWESGGILSGQTITYTTNETIASLATAINAVGSGWSATADSVLGAWPVTEIMDGLASKGAGPNDQPYGAARFHVYSQNITNARFHEDDGQRTGVVWVGRRWGDGIDWSWGPDAPMWSDGVHAGTGRVRATYNGGYATIPRELQLACVELVKSQLNRLGTDLILRSESAGEYRYEINTEQVMALPRHVLQAITRYRVVNA